MREVTDDFSDETVIVTGGASGNGRVGPGLRECGGVGPRRRRSRGPDDVTGTALFLESDDVRYEAGEHLHLDGGYRTR